MGKKEKGEKRLSAEEEVVGKKLPAAATEERHCDDERSSPGTRFARDLQSNFSPDMCFFNLC